MTDEHAQVANAAPESARPKSKMEIDISAELAFLDELAGDGRDTGPSLPEIGVAQPGGTDAEASQHPGRPVAPQAPFLAKEEIKMGGCSRLNEVEPQAVAFGEFRDPAAADSSAYKADGDEDEEESLELDAAELLEGFKAGKEETPDEKGSSEEVMKAFLDDMRAVDRDNEVNRIFWAFKLNPFDKLNLRFTATESEVKKQYRKISLLIHPDKCKHPNAADAFELLGAAQRELLDDERRAPLMRMLEYAREHVRSERQRATKHDAALRLAASLHSDGRAGVEREWEETEDFHTRWREKAHDVLARAEFRRRKLAKRALEEETRTQADEKEAAQQRKKQKQLRKDFLETRGSRVKSWRDWAKSGKKVGGTKASTIKTYDTERSYVQRATTEQFIGNYRKKPPK